jgi:hypothetical protein
VTFNASSVCIVNFKQSPDWRAEDQLPGFLLTIATSITLSNQIAK